MLLQTAKMMSRTSEQNRKRSRSSKRRRSLLQSPRGDGTAIAADAEPLGGDDDSEDHDVQYQHYSILRVNNSASKSSVQPSLPSRGQEGKSRGKKRSRKAKASVEPEVQHDATDSACDSSVSVGDESSAKELVFEGLSKTWQSGVDNCIELLRSVVAEREIVVLRVKKPGIALAGSGWMRVVRGSASVLGADLTAKSASIYIVSAPMAPFAVTIVPCAMPQDTVPDNGLEDWLAELSSSFASVDAVAQAQCSPDECIVLFAENCKPKTENREYSQYLLGKGYSDIPSSCQSYLRRAGLPTCADGALLVRGLSILGKNDKLPCFALWSEWDLLTKKLSNFIQKSQRTSDLRILVCGGGGTGKSMAVRCTINYLLSRHKQVLLIDTDVGQPEMNIPGLVAAHAVHRMRGGAPAASNRGSPIAAAFFGDITPQENPDLYADCIRHVIARGRAYAHEVNCPVIVNTDGWISGTGAALLQLVFKYAMPSHVVSMAFGDSGNAADAGREEQTGITEIVQAVQMDRMFQLVSPLPARTSFYSGVSLRDLHVATYFSDEIESGRVRIVSIDDMQVATVSEPVPNKLLCAALNACVVAIACTEGRKGSVAEWNVRGFGMVRAVDAHARNLYVATPVSEVELENCDALIVSAGVQVASGLFLAMAGRAAPWLKLPYITSSVVATGGQMKSRPSLQRRR